MNQQAAPERSALQRMLEARSVALVGASQKEGSLGRQMLIELRRGGFDGDIYPVNPGYDEIDGVKCYPSIGDVPGPVDLAMLGLANARMEDAVRAAADAGAASIVTFASLYEENTPPGSPPLMERLATIARDAGMAFCGGNGMGFLNLETRVRATGFDTIEHISLGPVTFISHSGSTFAALAYNDRGIGFNLLISSGQEIVTTTADYMEYALALDSTRVIGLVIETARNPDRFRAMLARAAAQDVAVVALKVGRTELSKAMVTAHSGALAGEHGAYEALFDAYGVLEVRTLDEMADTLELLSCPRRVVSGSGLAAVNDSGGERSMLVDLAADLGVPLARVSEETLASIQDTLDPGMQAANPMDAWGTGIDADRIFLEGFRAFHEDPETAVMAFAVDLTRQGEPYDEGYLAIARHVFETTTKPFCVLANLASAVALEEAAHLREAGIPVLEGTASALLAIRHLFEERDHRERPALTAPEPIADEVRDRWRARLATGAEVSELEGLALLADYGVPVVAARAASSADEAVAAAEQIGWPVALKTASPGIQHKSDVGGVKLGLADEAELRGAFEEIAARLGPQVAVAAMAPKGVELALGVIRDPQFGPLVLVAAGGILVELLHDRRLAFPPLDEPRARSLIDGLATRPLLDGVRGAPASDVDAVASAVSRLSLLAADLGDLIEAVDVNPLIASPEGCVAVDALVIPGSP